ncbi:uncharacterized protein LOC120112141 [Phoenix dactylifera]|uniref:Uncharacterized protein LOC120112141 n=1 Tax=Phoenix dactylifera TaxID=42345 RepID=A0A8B9AK52_PHODC|nr:uncharacterized protein LOC120112141 [Phoenix dactylifera]
MKKTSPRLNIERKSSIEDEPRTLRLDQFQYAREEALCVLSTKTIEEALKIFTDGLKPVLSIRDNKDLDADAEMLDCAEMEHLNLPLLKRETVSSPF